MTTDEINRIKWNVETLMGNSRALFNILGALVSVTLDSHQKDRLAVLLEEHANAIETQIGSYEDVQGPGVPEEAEQLKQEHAGYLHVIDIARKSN